MSSLESVHIVQSDHELDTKARNLFWPSIMRMNANRIEWLGLAAMAMCALCVGVSYSSCDMMLICCDHKLRAYAS